LCGNFAFRFLKSSSTLNPAKLELKAEVVAAILSVWLQTEAISVLAYLTGSGFDLLNLAQAWASSNLRITPVARRLEENGF
jgi:hypothetical protein